LNWISPDVLDFIASSVGSLKEAHSPLQD